MANSVGGIAQINVIAAWIAFLLGAAAGLVIGVFFHEENWLGGYASWRRRMIRLGHIAFFGIGIINLSFALTARALGLESAIALPSLLLVIGAATMPLVCFLSAWRLPFRNAFAVPALATTLGIALFLREVLLP